MSLEITNEFMVKSLAKCTGESIESINLRMKKKRVTSDQAHFVFEEAKKVKRLV